MTIPTYTVSLQDIQDEFGGSTPISLSEYYAGGGLVTNPAPKSSYQSDIIVPTSGTIQMNSFRGLTKFTTVTISEFGTQVDMYGHGNGPWNWSNFRTSTGANTNATNLHFILTSGGGRPAQESDVTYTWSVTKISGTGNYTVVIQSPGESGSEIPYPSPLTTSINDRIDFKVTGNDGGKINQYRISVTDGITTSTKDIFVGLWW